MPSAPEFPDRERKIRAFKVGHQLNAKKSGTSDGDVRIAGKITVDLDGKHQGNDDKDKAHIAVGVVVDLVHHHGKDIRDHQLLKISPGHQLQAVGHIVVVKSPFFFQLREKRIRPADGACQQLREERDEQGVVAEVALCTNFSLIDIDEISHGLKKIERDARRKQDPQGHGMYGEAACVDQGIQSVDGGASQLKNKEDADQGQNAGEQTAPFGPFIRCFLQTQGQEKGQRSGGKEQKPVSHMKIHIEGIACRQQENPAESGGHDMIQDKYHCQKDSESHGMKEHGFLQSLFEADSDFGLILLYCKNYYNLLVSFAIHL